MLRKSAAALVAAPAAYAAYKYKTDEGFRRATKLYTVGGPVVAAYRWEEWKQTSRFSPVRLSDDPSEKEKKVADAAWAALDEKHSVTIVELLNDLQGMYTKYGQTCAGMTNTFSEAWTDKLRTLEDGVTPQPKEIVYQTILEEFGKPAEEIFSEFDDVPLGSASIGQVHRAVLRSTGKEVAVKCQYPEAQRLFAEDMKTIRSFFAIAAPEQLIILDEMSRSFQREFDYTVEAANLATVDANMTKAGFCPREAVVPKPHMDFTTRRVLTMDLLPGPKLITGLKAYAKIMAEEQGMTLGEFEKSMEEKIRREGVRKYDGPSAGQIDSYLKYMRWRDWTLNLGVSVYNALGGKMEYYKTTLPPNAPRIMDTLMRIHGHQLLVDGLFNADPHAGNFLLLPDDRLALIDYGATKELTREERLIACVLYAALYRDDEKLIADCVKYGGYKSKHMRDDIILKLVKFGFDTYGKELIGDKNIQQFVDECYREDPWMEAADNLVMAQFLSIRLRLVGMAMNHAVKCSDWWGEIAIKALKDEGLPYEVWNLETMEKELGTEGLSIAKGAAA